MDDYDTITVGDRKYSAWQLRRLQEMSPDEFIETTSFNLSRCSPRQINAFCWAWMTCTDVPVTRSYADVREELLELGIDFSERRLREIHGLSVVENTAGIK